MVYSATRVLFPIDRTKALQSLQGAFVVLKYLKSLLGFLSFQLAREHLFLHGNGFKI